MGRAGEVTKIWTPAVAATVLWCWFVATQWLDLGWDWWPL
jgi:hypothetical protein